MLASEMMKNSDRGRGMNTKALISCIVPLHNGELYVREALDSILAQTYPYLEVIVADDGSTDGSASIVASYGDQIRHVRQPVSGPAAARNLGLGVARGDFVAFLDHDDLWHPEKLARQMSRFQARPSLDLCVTHVQVFWSSEVAEEGERYQGHPRAQPVPGYTTPTLLARRGLFEIVGRFDTTLRFADAFDWFLRAARHGAVIELLPDVLVYHRMHESNHTRRFASASREEFLQVVKASLDWRRLHQEHSLSSFLASSSDANGGPVLSSGRGR
jgi:glycosyltransferase involved in cell wall biosynthesis